MGFRGLGLLEALFQLLGECNRAYGEVSIASTERVYVWPLTLAIGGLLGRVYMIRLGSGDPQLLRSPISKL